MLNRHDERRPDCPPWRVGHGALIKPAALCINPPPQRGGGCARERFQPFHFQRFPHTPLHSKPAYLQPFLHTSLTTRPNLTKSFKLCSHLRPDWRRGFPRLSHRRGNGGEKAVVSLRVPGFSPLPQHPKRRLKIQPAALIFSQDNERYEDPALP